MRGLFLLTLKSARPQVYFPVRPVRSVSAQTAWTRTSQKLGSFGPPAFSTTAVNMSDTLGTFVSAKWLADTLASSPKNLRVLDGTWTLPNMQRNAKEDYTREHIPGAMFFDINECCDKSDKAKNLAVMLPASADFETYVGKLGINNETRVIVYDNNDKFPVFSAQRVWWMFRVFGHENVAVLDGGLRKWRELTKQVSDSVSQVAEEKFTAHYNPKLVKSFEEIEANLEQKSFALVDARTPDHFLGTAPITRPDRKPGCIPGSLNLPFLDLMDLEQQTFRSKEELTKKFEQLPVDLKKPLTATCGSGISACMIAIAGHVCGKEDVAVYDGAWTEWYQRARPDQKKNVPSD